MHRSLNGAMRQPRWLAILAVSVFLATAACSDSGTAEPTDEEVREAEDILADQEATAQQAVADAITTIEARLVQVQPCEPIPGQIADLYEPIATLQQTGHPDADAFLARANTALAPVVRAFARAWANGELQTMHPEITGENIDDWARSAGVDPTQDGWMSDPNCQVRWRIDAQYVANITGDAPMDLVHLGSAEFAAFQGGPLSGSGPMNVTASGSIPSAGCMVTWDTCPGNLDIEGEWLFVPNGLAVTVTFGAVSFTPNLVCPFGSPPTTTGTSEPFDVAVTLAAEDGYVHSEPWSAPTGSGEMRFTVTKLP